MFPTFYRASTFQPDDTSMSGVLGVLFESAAFWLTVVVLVMISILPDLVIRVVRDTTTPVYRKISNSKTACCGMSRRSSFNIKHVSKDIELSSVQRYKLRASNSVGVYV